jgi:hypothetical protein
MLKQIRERMSYALIGFALGAVLATVLWFLYDAGFSRRTSSPEIHLGLRDWIQYGGGAFALVGFLFKDRVGSAIGLSAREVQRYESGHDELPRWLALLLLAVLVGGLWWLFR